MENIWFLLLILLILASFWLWRTTTNKKKSSAKPEDKPIEKPIEPEREEDVLNKDLLNPSGGAEVPNKPKITVGDFVLVYQYDKTTFEPEGSDLKHTEFPTMAEPPYVIELQPEFKKKIGDYEYKGKASYELENMAQSKGTFDVELNKNGCTLTPTNRDHYMNFIYSSIYGLVLGGSAVPVFCKFLELK